MSSRSPMPDPWRAIAAFGLALGLGSANIGSAMAASTAETGMKTTSTAPAPATTNSAPTDAGDPLSVPTTMLYPGGQTAPPADPNVKKYQGNAKEIAQGEKLFNWYNCSGCHFHGAGGMGPPFMNGGHWIYGGRLDQIYASIYQGRPNGMPSWGHKIPPEQIWQIAAYVKALSMPSESAVTGGPPIATPPSQPQTSGKSP